MRYYWGQFVQAALIPVGLLILWLPCMLRAWRPDAVSNKTWEAPWEILNGRAIDSWSWRWLNSWFGNPEDGVSGIYALIWKDANTLIPYNPAGSRWKAYCWSAWRNSVDALKYSYPGKPNG